MAQSILDLIFRTSKQGNAEKQVTGDLGELNRGLSGTVQELTGLNLASLTAVGGIVAVGKAIWGAIESAGEAQQIQAQLNAVIKSTGGVAGVTAEQVNNMANGMSLMTGINDDAIIKASALMLTFTNIGEETFPRAMQAAADMAAVMGTDVQGSIIQLGKALNNPIQGMSALQRVGVAFTQDQKDMITSLQESGDIMGAQAIILKELETEFGGAAVAMGDTLPGAIDKARNAFENLQESIGAMPVAGRSLVDWVTDAINSVAMLATIAGQARPAFDNLNDAAARSATSYGEYWNQAILAADATGNLKMSVQGVPTSFASVTDAMKAQAEGLGILTEEQWNAVNAIDAWEGKLAAAQDSTGLAYAANEDYVASLYEVSPAADDAGGGIDELITSLDTVKASFGELTNQMLFNKAAAGLDGDAALVLARSLGLLNEDTYAALTQIDNLRQSYDLNKDAAIDASENAMGFAQAAVAVGAQAGLTQDHIDTLTSQFADLDGTTSSTRASIQTMSSAMKAVPVVVQTDMSQLIASSTTAANKTGDIRDNIFAIPRYTYSEIEIATHNYTYNHPPTNFGSESFIGQHGLDAIVPAGFPNDTFPIFASSGERVTIQTPAQQARGGVPGGGNAPVYVQIYLDGRLIQQSLAKGARAQGVVI